MQVRTCEPLTCREPGGGVMQVRTVVDRQHAQVVQDVARRLHADIADVSRVFNDVCQPMSHQGLVRPLPTCTRTLS